MVEPSKARQLLVGLLKAAVIIALLFIVSKNEAFPVYPVVLAGCILSIGTRMPGLEAWIVQLGACVALLLFPLFYPPHHLLLTYIIFIPLVACGIILRLRYGSTEFERFIEKWERTRQKGFWFNFLKDSAQSMLALLLVILMIMVMYYLFENCNALEFTQAIFNAGIKTLTVMFSILIISSCIAGAISWFEKENRYYKM